MAGSEEVEDLEDGGRGVPLPRGHPVIRFEYHVLYSCSYQTPVLYSTLGHKKQEARAPPPLQGLPSHPDTRPIFYPGASPPTPSSSRGRRLRETAQLRQPNGSSAAPAPPRTLPAASSRHQSGTPGGEGGSRVR
ncbi:hypothetical protein SKAU_G00363560 [Synaphobranchus kaupii]|uniref:Uncharacterized protein n=1 Tax=Synaphobranchus kaupii TaxID=118154 RepID=A0A9Q1IGC6_SYNKA|nr:hypothetical protein SKAU_G00363560 [Synaphobranchus kaupii]